MPASTPTTIIVITAGWSMSQRTVIMTFTSGRRHRTFRWSRRERTLRMRPGGEEQQDARHVEHRPHAHDLHQDRRQQRRTEDGPEV